MENICQSCGSLYLIYNPFKCELLLTNGGEFLKREQLLTLKTLLQGAVSQKKVCGSLLLSYQETSLSLDWGYQRIDVGEKTTINALRDFLHLLTLTQEKIYFYKIEEQPYGCFSNLAPYGVELEGRWWATIEHYFQAKKFLNPYLQELIRSLPSAKRAAIIGRDKKFARRFDWEQVKVDVMRTAVFQKFKTHDALHHILLETGEKEIVEDAPDDYYWGCGTDGSGQNQLGKILVEVRGLLRRGENVCI